MHVMGVVEMNKNPYEEGTPEYDIFEAGIALERNRLLKVLDKYHHTFCGGPLENHPECTKTMEIRYLFDFMSGTKTLK